MFNVSSISMMNHSRQVMYSYTLFHTSLISANKGLWELWNIALISAGITAYRALELSGALCA